jgi:hypothetical protein
MKQRADEAVKKTLTAESAEIAEAKILRILCELCVLRGKACFSVLTSVVSLISLSPRLGG